MTSRLHLEDHKLVLGTHRLEHGIPIEYFDPEIKEWVEVRWDSPLLVERAGAAILLRALGVNDLEHWNIHVGIALGERWHKKRTVQKTRRL